MRYQTHSESPILSNLTLKLDIAKGSASCGIAVGEVAEVGEVGKMGDNDTTHCVSIFTTLSQQCRTAVVTDYPLGICGDTNLRAYHERTCVMASACQEAHTQPVRNDQRRKDANQARCISLIPRRAHRAD